MAKILTISNAQPGEFKYLFWCPGCEEQHGFNDGWTFNGDIEKPTVSPSILVNVGRRNPEGHLCHMFVSEGKIQFLSDCTHELAGQTVDMVDQDEV